MPALHGHAAAASRLDCLIQHALRQTYSDPKDKSYWDEEPAKKAKEGLPQALMGDGLGAIGRAAAGPIVGFLHKCKDRFSAELAVRDELGVHLKRMLAEGEKP